MFQRLQSDRFHYILDISWVGQVTVLFTHASRGPIVLSVMNIAAKEAGPEDIQAQRHHLTYPKSQAVKDHEPKRKGVGIFSQWHCDYLS